MNEPWWKRTTVYQIYPRSFADSNADGVGDLPGIIDRLDYLAWLGVETLWLSPIYRSPQADFGYDISGHYEIAPEYGSVDDVHRLIEEAHARGLKIVFDLVLNHTSIEHPWFVESRSSRDNPRRDFYLWRDGRRPGGAAPPNNWLSMLGGSGWHYDERTDQHYFATFLPFQPDLNWRNPEVRDAMLDVVRHWLRLGVDGLRLDLFNALFKDASFADNPPSFRPFPSETNPDGFFQRALHTQNHPDTIDFARQLRAVVDEFSDPPRFLVGEVFGEPELLRRYCGPGGEGLHLVFLFKSLQTPFRAPSFRALMEELEIAFADPLYPTYVFSNHDRPRAMARLSDDPRKARLLAAFQLTVRGVPFIYYGEELGLSHPIADGPALDPIAARMGSLRLLSPLLRRRGILLNRDEARSPMPWSDAPHAGFAPPHAAPPWLPLHPQALTRNVAAQRAADDSVLATYRRLLRLRRGSAPLSAGGLALVEPGADPRAVLAYERTHGAERATVVLNFSDREQRIDLRRLGHVPTHSNVDAIVRDGSGITSLRPWEGVVALG